MVQVLPYIPSFAERLTNVLGDAAQNVAQGYIDNRKLQQDQNIINSFDPNDSPIGQIQKFSRLSPQSQQTLSPLLQQLLSAQQAQALESQRQDLKKQEKLEAEKKEHEDISELINESVDELMKGKLGFFNQYNKATSKGRESRAYFDELALGIEKRLATMVGKGALSVPRFEYLKSLLPNSSNTDANNRGKLRALAKEFKVIVENPEFKEVADSSDKSSQGVYVISPTGQKKLIPVNELQRALDAGGRLQ